MSVAQGITEEALGRLVERFYAKVRLDPLIGPVFNAAIDDWDEDKDLTPFSGDDPAYKLESYAEGDDLQDQADREFAKADFYDARGDDFVRATVLFAIALGLLGIGGVLARWRNKLLFAGGGLAALIGGVIFVAVNL